MLHAVTRLTGARRAVASRLSRVVPLLVVVVIITTGTVVPDAAPGMM